MKHWLFILLLIPGLLNAQDEKYLAGAVPEVNGKVVFTKEIQVPSFTGDQLYEKMLTWAESRFQEGKNRVAYADKEKGDIAALGEEYLVFSSGALSLDRSMMSYRMTIECENQLCKLSVTGIRYEYNVSYKKEPEKYIAEEWITDKHALSKGKLNRVSGKFRKGTINYVDNLFTDAINFLNQEVATIQLTPQTETAPVVNNQPVVITATTVEPQPVVTPQPAVSPPKPRPVSGSLENYRQVAPDKIPGNIVKMLSEDWMLITAGNDDEFNMMTASWGGLGVAFGKPIAICFINPSRYTYQLMEKNDTYTFTFYTEAYRDVLQYCGSASGRDKDKVKESGLTPITTPEGSKAFGEAWMVIECKKMISQPLSTEVVNDEKLKEQWIGKQMNKMYIGEIINVWIK